MKRAFTLIEMTIVIAIIGILAAMAVPIYATALSQSKAHRTRAIVAKIDTIIGEKWEGYRTRQVPIRILPNTPPGTAAQFRLNALRELMRMEMPDRISDVTIAPVTLATRPAVNKQYNRRALATWDNRNENAECLYLILAATRDGDRSALDYFAPSEIGDVDGDGMNEILDGWGQPIAFLRWAPGYRADVAPFPVTPQSAADADPFDPLKIDYRYRDNNPANDPFALKPLIVSGGPDKRVAISVNTPNDAMGVPMPYATSSPPNDPYWPQAVMVGFPFSSDATDNITNHDLEAR